MTSKPLYLTRKLKEAIEEKTVLLLGDLVNVALFVLTIVSLSLSGAGVHYAWKTLRSADEGAKAMSSLARTWKLFASVPQMEDSCSAPSPWIMRGMML